MEVEAFIKICDDIVTYYDSTRACGHTQATAKPGHRGDFAILTVNRLHSQGIETRYGVACVEMERIEKLRGTRLPLILDNFTVSTLLGFAARFLAALTKENRRLALSLEVQQTINGDLRRENERLQTTLEEYGKRRKDKTLKKFLIVDADELSRGYPVFNGESIERLPYSVARKVSDQTFVVDDPTDKGKAIPGLGG